ncbi:MAG: HAD family hydrolase [Bacillota bacterium]
MKWTVETIIFDLDGVIIDSGPDIANAANLVLGHFGLAELPSEKIVSFIGGGVEPLVYKCLGEKNDKLYEQALPLFKQFYKENCCKDTKLYPGVAEILHYYNKMGKKMTIATNKTEAITEQILQGLGVMHFFQIIVGPDSLTKRKPDPEGILCILQQTGSAKDKSVIIGDSATDVAAGKAAGIITGAAAYGFGSISDLENEKPDFTIKKAAELVQYLK